MEISKIFSLVSLYIRSKSPFVKLLLNCGNMSNKSQDAIRERKEAFFYIDCQSSRFILRPFLFETCHLFRKHDKLTFDKSSSYFLDQRIYLIHFQC